MKKRLSTIIIAALSVLLVTAIVFVIVLAARPTTQSDENKPAPEEKKTYTVSYDGTEYADLKLEEGETIERPVDPYKGGEVFVDWYTDEDYETKYSFGTKIESDVRIYARFIQSADPEFTVSYIVDGERYKEASTIGGMAIDAPVPTKEGHTFVGWWVSEYAEADKLTYEYDGRALSEDTVMYAVWDKAAITVDADGIRWPTKTNTSVYSVSVKKDGVEIQSHRQTGGNEWAYDFTELEAGDYEVVVTSDDESATAYYRNKGLAKVSKFEVIGGSVLYYNAVEGASKYYITIECGNSDHKHVMYDNGNKVTYDFSGCEMSETGITFKVTAVGEGYATSESTEFNYAAYLNGLYNLEVKEDVLTWDDASADYYIVNIDGEEHITDKTEYKLNYYAAGEYDVKVTAIARGYVPAKAETTYVKESLSAPTGLKLRGTTVTWDEVEGAASYVVKVGEEEHAVEGNSYELEESDDRIGVSVKAVKGAEIKLLSTAKEASKDSAYSDELKVSKFVTGIEYEDGKAKWDAVYGATEYKVTVNSNASTRVRTTENNCELPLTKKGENVITVTAISGRVETSVGNTVVNAHEVKFNVDGGNAINPVYVADGDVITNVGITSKYGYTLGSWYDVIGAASVNAAKINLEAYKVYKDITVYAQWDAKTIKLKLDVQGGEVLDKTEYEVTFGENFELPTASIDDEDRYFTGWFSDANARGSQYTDEDGVSISAWAIDREEMTVYAAWLKTLTYDLINNGAAYSVSQGPDIDKVTSVRIPVTYKGLPVTTVEGSAFRNCANLLTVNIPDTIQNVETGTAFLSCDNLTAVNVYAVDDYAVEYKPYYSVDGVLFYDNANNEGREIKYYPLGKSGSYTIPEGVEVIPINVFRSANIDILHVPYTVVKIDKNAFSSFTLKSVIFDNAPAGEEGEPLDITDGAFGYGQNLTSVTFPRRLRTFTAKVFGNTYNLNEVKMDGTGEYFSAESGVLMTADKSQIVYCPPAKVSVDIPATVQIIGKNAFEGSNLTSLTIPANVTTIQESAFKSSASLRSLTFEGTLQDDALTIEANAFSECAKISSVTLPGNLKVLKANAFANCSILQKVIVNSGADVEFEANAFYDKLTNGSNLVELDIGPDFYCENVGAVFGGPNLATLKTDDANPNFTAINNVLYAINKADSTLAVQYFPVGNRVADLKIDERVSAIGDRVFENIITLKSVTIPATVRKIGAYAFSGCRFMETVTFEAREITETLEIGNYAFNNCAAIKVLDLPAGTTKLGDYDTSGNISDLKVFSGCSSLTAINVGEGGEYFYSKDGILYGTSVDGKKVLYTCPALCVVTSLEIPSDLNEIFDYAFAGNNSIETITFEITTVDAEQFHIGRGAFSEMGGLKTVTLPEGVEVVGEEMFKNSSIETFECPVSVTTLGVDSFYGTSNLSSFTFREGRTQGISLAPGGMIPPDWWYSEGDGEYGGTPSSPYDSRGVFILSGLPSIDLPAGSTIGKYAFAWSSLNSITIPAGTKNIAEATFAYAGLTSVTISEGVEKIDDYAFYQCSRLRSVTLPDSCKTVGWGSFSGCGLSSLDLGSVVTIGESSFANMYNLSGTLTIPNTVTYIGEGAFSQIGASKVVFEDDDEEHQRDTLALCTLGSWGGVFIFCDSLEEVVFPNMKGTIEVKQQDTYNGYGSVFFMCGAYNYETGEQSISKVTLGSGIATLEYLFSECSIGEIVGLDDNPNFYIDKETHVLYNASKTEIFQALDGFDIEDYRVPEDVTKIHSGAFQGVESLKSVYIPNSVSYIGDQAFYLCPNLTKVRFADDFNHDMTWGSSVFAGNYRVPSAVSDVVFPITITTIGDSMFRYSSVKFVSYENFPGIIDVGEYGFNGSALEYIDLSKNKGFNMGFTYYIDPSSLEELFHGREAFSNCDNLKSVILNDDIKAIAAAAFDFDFGLEEIIIPDGVIEIGMYAFRGTSLKSIVIPDSVQYLGGGGSAESPAGAFSGCSELEEVTIGTSGASDIQMIGDFSGGYTFANCTNLKKVTLYGNPMRVGLGAFNNCSNLTEFVFGEGSMIETISEAMLKDLPITSITLPDTVRRIEANAFNGCTELKEINIPDALEYIGDFAFANTAIGGEFYINGNVTNIGAGAFRGTNITDFIVDATNSLYTSDENGIIYDISDAIYAFPAGKEISELRLDSQVKSIKNYAFAGVKHIKSIFIPETVMEIGTGAFSGWTSEQSIVFEVSMEEGEFYGGGWRIGNKALKYFSNGDEFEEPGSYMVEDYDASKVPETLYTYHADDGFRIVVSRTQTTVYNAGDPEYEFSQTQISNYTFGHKGDVYMFGQATDYSSSENYYELGLDDGTYNMIYKRGDTYYRASYDASNLNVLTLISNQDFVQSLMSYTSLNEEMKKTEVEFLGRKCYKYTYVTTAETIEFIFDQETGLCFKGKTQGVSRWGNYPVYTSWEVTVFEAGYDLVIPEYIDA